MTLDELNTLRQSEVVEFTSIGEDVNIFNEYKLGDELIFLEFNEHTNYYNFVRVGVGPPVICHFGLHIHSYIERKIVLERNKKITQLGL